MIQGNKLLYIVLDRKLWSCLYICSYSLLRIILKYKNFSWNCCTIQSWIILYRKVTCLFRLCEVRWKLLTTRAWMGTVWWLEHAYIFTRTWTGVTGVLQSSSIHSPSLQLSFRSATTFREGANLQYKNVHLSFWYCPVSCISLASPINVFSYLSLVPVGWKSTTFSKDAKLSERSGKKPNQTKKTAKGQSGFGYNHH